ncbi:hypothetical protein PROFUN_09178 [Planoprotostelium fungivorum]|uniref:Uncharacterized protein n=1 Tax=Planoprotostelium fungivorum TaxID=1890364 RepID=A0A2P6MVN5_9EUKA|nr:hypothetical protein PROFUN_09178 [Planoprotostelium fungivorum]
MLPYTYVLSLPPSIKIYPVFHTSLLTLYMENTLICFIILVPTPGVTRVERGMIAENNWSDVFKGGSRWQNQEKRIRG